MRTFRVGTKSTLIVLNRYFDLNPEESWSLDRRLTSKPMQRHPFLYPLLYSFSKKKVCPTKNERNKVIRKIKLEKKINKFISKDPEGDSLPIF